MKEQCQNEVKRRNKSKHRYQDDFSNSGWGVGVFAYTELTARLVSLETSRELFQADLLKKSEQLPVDQEQLMLLEDLYKSVEKLEKNQEQNMTNKVNIQFLREQLDKALQDIEKLKDKQREFVNGSGH